ncbi:MAG: ABC transporter permease [Saccharofermentans sp.]|nr:ABC transporter permease [Saccharofermentans sp.]
MFWRIIKKDMTRKKTFNIILILFVILATMFVSSGISNIITVLNGTDYYFEQAGVGDYIIISRDAERDNLDDFLNNTKLINSYTVENTVYASNECAYDKDGNVFENKNMVMLQAMEDTGFKYFDSNNEVVTSISKGHCYATGSFMEKNDIQIGDPITIKTGKTEMTLILDGVVKDALLGSDFMGNSRFLLSPDDFQVFDEDEGSTNMHGQILNIHTDDVDSVRDAASNLEGVLFSDTISTIKLSYVMDMIVAFVVLILSVCLMVVSFVVLKFAINLTITEEYREIGVMKAIGIGNTRIRSLYITKYFLIAILGSIIGLFISFPFGKMLIKSVSNRMVLGNSLGYTINIIGAVIVVIAIVGFAYISTNKVKKATPVDAIRSGQTGERYNRKSALRLRKFNGNSSSFMAVNDILSSPRRYTTIVAAFSLCTLFVLVLVNTVNTMKSDNLLDTFASRSDLYINVTDVDTIENFTNNFKSRDDVNNYFNEIKEDFAREGIPCEVCMDFQYKCPVTANGKTYSIVAQQGINTKMTDYTYYEGVAPSSPDEIAITPQIADMLGIKIGDTVTINYGFETRDVIVTAYFQTMNSLGQIIRIHEDAKTDITAWSSIFALQIKYSDNPTNSERIDRKAIAEKYFDNVYLPNEYQIDCLAVVPTMEMVQYLLLAITLLVVIFVTVLMERSFVSDEKKEIAILKAIGFKNKNIISWQVLRFGLVAFISGIIAALLSIPMTNLCITPIFGMMGMQKVTYEIEPLKIFLMYPLIIVAMTVIVAFFTSLCACSIKSSDTANIE